MKPNYIARRRAWLEGVSLIPQGKFNFGTWGGYKGDMYSPVRVSLTDNEHTCTTIGCAGGYLPCIFPKDWRGEKTGPPVLRRGSTGGPTGDVAQYFGLDRYITGLLIYPGSRHGAIPGMSPVLLTPEKWVRGARRIFKAAGVEF